jgi:hypothetical protein
VCLAYHFDRGVPIGPGSADRQQRTSKVRRRRPGRKDHKPPGPPLILKMGTILKEKLAKTLAMAQGCNCK